MHQRDFYDQRHVLISSNRPDLQFLDSVRCWFTSRYTSHEKGLPRRDKSVNFTDVKPEIWGHVGAISFQDAAWSDTESARCVNANQRAKEEEHDKKLKLIDVSKKTCGGVMFFFLHLVGCKRHNAFMF